MKKICWFLLLCPWLSLSSQETKELNYPAVRYPLKTFTRHGGFWITHPKADFKQYSVQLYRKTFTLEHKPDSLIIHISADNLYRLYVNGKYVCMGPARNDLYHWNYETIDIAPFMQKGKNVIAVQVNNFGHQKANAQCSFKTGLLIVAHYPSDTVVNTDDKTWKTYLNTAFRERPVEWMYQKDIASGWYCINPNDSIIGSLYPWGWEQPGYNDSHWDIPVWLGSVNIRYTGQHGPLLLEPRRVKLLHHSIERIPAIVRTENITLASGKKNFLTGNDSLVVPPASSITLLLDNQKMTMGFPLLCVSKGKGSTIKVRYAECLFDEKKEKDNRNEIKGKRMIGYYDVFLPEGGYRRTYQALWYRAFRYVQLEITTAAEPLVINDFYNVYTAYPFEMKASFSCNDPVYRQIWDAGWRTVSICSQDFYMSDAYYETMQYIADTRVHGIVTAVLTGDYSLYRQAIRQFDQSRIPDGLTLAAYPNDWYWVLPYFSLMWVDMVYDYTMVTGDTGLAREMLPGIRCVVDWFNRHLNGNHLLGFLEWANPNGSRQNSTLFSLYYAYSLNHTATLCSILGNTEESALYRQRAGKIASAVYRLSWDENQQKLAETPEKNYFTQWGNIMGILTDAVPEAKQKDLMERILTDTTMPHVGYFESFYLFEALKKTGLGHLFDRELQPWRDQIKEGLTTFKEIPSKAARSDTHPWSTSPLYYYFDIICGIKALAPGYRSVEIAPSPGKLTFIKASMPVPSGTIVLDLKKDGKTGISGIISLPENTTGTFIWGTRQIPLKGGQQTIRVK